MTALILALLLAQAPQQSLSGSVVITARDAVTQAGIPGVFVTLTYKFPLEPAGASTSLLTDQEGRAAFNLPAGNYRMAAERQGYVITSSLQDVFLDPGERQTRAISFNPLAAITGRLRYANGDPAPLVSVSAASIGYRLGQSALTSRASQTTDERGEFRIPVPPGEYYVKIDNSNRLNRGPQTVPRIAFYPGVLRVSEARAISIQGESVDIGDISLPRSTVVSVTGTVAVPAVDENNFAVPRIYLVPADPNDLEEPIQVQAGRPTAIGSGEFPFQIEGISPGSYFLYASQQISAANFLEKIPVTVTDRDLVNLRIAIKPAVDLPVRVLVLGDKSAVSLEDVSIRLQQRDRLPRITGTSDFSTVRIDPLTGESTIPSLGNGLRFSIRVSGLSANAYVADIRQGARSVFKDSTIEATVSAGPVEIEIRTQGGVIQGLVRDASNQPVQGTVVLIPDLARQRNLDLYKSVATGSSGQFTVRGIAPGQFQIFAVAKRPESAIDDPAFIAQHAGRMTPISVSASSTIEISLRTVP